MEEVTAYGAEDAAVARQSRELFRSERQDYIRSLNHEFKATLGEDLKGVRAPRLRLASLELPNRGWAPSMRRSASPPPNRRGPCRKAFDLGAGRYFPVSNRDSVFSRRTWMFGPALIFFFTLPEYTPGLRASQA